MVEAWDELGSSRTQRQLCAEKVKDTMAACAKEHEKRHVVECPECYGRVLDRIRDRYLETPDQEWFTGRRAFLQGLSGMFADAKQYRTDLQSIEARIEQEKRRWYAQRVKDSTAIRRIVDDAVGRDVLLDRLSDQTVSFEGLVEEVRAALRKGAGAGAGAGAGDSLDVRAALERLSKRQEPAERQAAYREIFFGEGSGPAAHRYAEMLQSGTPIDVVMCGILGDRSACLGAQDRRERHRRRLDELRRAKTAHELQKTKRTGGSGAAGEGTGPAARMYDLPPCVVCGKAPDTSDFLACSLCQVLTDLGARKETTVYCSTECHERGYDSHVDEAHACASGDNCVQLVDEEVGMDADDTSISLCSECVNTHKLPTVFCSPRCADASFQRHREDVHLPQRHSQDAEVEDEDTLAYEGEDKTKYNAKNISDHLIAMDEAMREFQQRNSVEALPLN